MKKFTLLLIAVLDLFVAPAWADSSFVVRNVQVDGLQRISQETVYSYLPIKRGQVLYPSKTSEIINSLYKTGFFEHISLDRDGNTLVIHVVERPTIGELKITGNSAIATDKLTTVMKSLDIAEGRVYNRAMLDKIRQSLLNQYYQLGRYNARVDINVTPQTRNRVLVKIEISEGLAAKIRRINIIGNHAFSEKELIKQLTITTPGLFTLFTQTDRYSQEKLDESLESLRNYYLNHGYLKIAIKSSQITITPDRKSVYVVIVVDEGPQYFIRGYDLTGNLIVPREDLAKLVKTKPGHVFSRQEILDTEKGISSALGDKGYVMCVVNINPNIDEKNKTVFVTYEVRPGYRTYVRHIYFSDNSRTNDEVLRRELPQMEGSLVSTSSLEESKHRLTMLPYLKDVQMSVKPVQNTKDQVDVNYKITEDKSAQANFSIGYSQLEHIILGAGVNQKNFLGTGKTLGLNFTSSRYEQYYGGSYTDPYFTPDGVSRTTSASYSKFNPAKANTSSSYTTNEYDLADVYSIPIGTEQSVNNRVQVGYGYQQTLVHVGALPSQAVLDFVGHYGRHFQQFELTAGYSRDSRDKAIFPTKGGVNVLGGDVFLPLNGVSLKYYNVNYDFKYFQPLTGEFIGIVRADFGYGNAFAGPKAYPFFKDYYGGGPGSVRGYLSNSLGPKDSTTRPSGGNTILFGSIGLIFPNHITENLRTTAFLDGGNVYNTFDNRSQGGTASGPLRYSAGLAADWLTPFGLIGVSGARALNPHPGDSLEWFQFSLGANLG